VFGLALILTVAVTPQNPLVNFFQKLAFLLYKIKNNSKPAFSSFQTKLHKKYGRIL
jgi:hypothetical protein